MLTFSACKLKGLDHLTSSRRFYLEAPLIRLCFEAWGLKIKIVIFLFFFLSAR